MYPYVIRLDMNTCNKHTDTELKIVGTGKNQRKKCPVCNKEYQAKWWKSNKETQIKRVKANTERYVGEAKAFILEYLLKNPCIDCGNADADVLEFDHREPSEKKYNISDMMRNGQSIESIGSEIAKCDVRCANCHRKKTRAQFSYYR